MKLTRNVLRGSIHTGKPKPPMEIESEGRGAIWWPPIIVMLAIFGWVIVSQIVTVLR